MRHLIARRAVKALALCGILAIPASIAVDELIDGTAFTLAVLGALGFAGLVALDRRINVRNPLTHTHEWEVQWNDDDKCVALGCAAYKFWPSGVIVTAAEYYGKTAGARA